MGGVLSALDPDLVLVTGDNMSHPTAVPGVLRALQPLLDVPGAFVFGSNDYRGPVWKNPFTYFDKEREYVQGVALPAEELRSVLVGAGWADLNNARTTLKAGGRLVELVGVDDPHVERDDYALVAGEASAAADLRVALTHTPEPSVLDAMAADGFDLLLGGHTHGGQVRVPFVGALVTNCGLPRTMARGLHRWPGTDSWLHVSAGPGHASDRPGAVRLPAGGVAADAHPTLTGGPGIPDLTPGGRGLLLPGTPRGVAQLGSALRSGRRGRRFESGHPDKAKHKSGPVSQRGTGPDFVGRGSRGEIWEKILGSHSPDLAPTARSRISGSRGARGTNTDRASAAYARVRCRRRGRGRALRPQQAEVTAPCDGFGAVGALQFPVDRGDVGLHGVAGDVQLLADLAEGEVGRQ